jgi:ADP-dependent NAD(P)H-hydrate dehydratase / NAD(P)H-hydrate epimerase
MPARPLQPLPQLAPILRVADLRALEARNTGVPLMERAGLAAAEVAHALLDRRGGRIVVLAGPGNNGGDAFVVARWLRTWFFDVITLFRGEASRLPRDAADAYAAFIAQGGVTTREIPDDLPALVVDGLFGIGLKRPPAAEHAALIDWANTSGAPILALDLPTGLDADTGAVFTPAIDACATATFIAWKPGLMTGDGLDRCGRVSVHSLDLDVEANASGIGRRLDWPSLAIALPDVLRRATRNVHKGSFGTLGIVGGASGMIGAPILAGRAAMKLGAGKVWVGFATRSRPAVDWLAPELMLRSANEVLADASDAIVIGPGLGIGDDARTLVERAIAAPVPLALDADALNVVAHDADLRAKVRARHAPTVVTPHPAEAGRLLGSDAATVGADRLDAASRLAHELNAHVVLKGAGSVLAFPGGGFDINASGGPALATAGSGDVLAGMLGALLAQRIDPRTALRYAVCLHGAAADALVARGVGPLGVVASEIADAARELVCSESLLRAGSG